jgi:GTPase SAR1 family protein
VSSALRGRLSEILDAIGSDDSQASLGAVLDTEALALLASALNEAKASLREPRVDIAFVGGFSSGKSTLINALVGADVLPSGMGVVTQRPVWIRPAARDRVGYWQRESFVPWRGPKRPWWGRLKDWVLGLFGRRVLALPPSIAAWIGGPHDWDTAEGRHWLALERADWPFGDEVTLIDTPGFNSEDVTHGDLTIEALDEAEVAVVVVPARGLSEDQRNFVVDVVLPRTKTIAFVLNQMDLVDELEDVQEAVRRMERVALRDFGLTRTTVLVCSARGGINPETGVSGWSEVRRWLEEIANHSTITAVAHKVALVLRGLLEGVAKHLLKEAATLEEAAQRACAEKREWQDGSGLLATISEGCASLVVRGKRASAARQGEVKAHMAAEVASLLAWARDADTDPTNADVVRLKLERGLAQMTEGHETYARLLAQDQQNMLADWWHTTDAALNTRWRALGGSWHVSTELAAYDGHALGGVRAPTNIELVDHFLEGTTALGAAAAGAAAGSIVPGIGTLIGGAVGFAVGAFFSGRNRRARTAIEEAIHAGAADLQSRSDAHFGDMERYFSEVVSYASARRFEHFRGEVDAFVAQITDWQESIARRSSALDGVRDRIRVWIECLDEILALSA